MPLTYRKLKNALNELSEKQLDMNISVFQKLSEDEIFLMNVESLEMASQYQDEIIESGVDDLPDTLPLLVLAAQD